MGFFARSWVLIAGQVVLGCTAQTAGEASSSADTGTVTVPQATDAAPQPTDAALAPTDAALQSDVNQADSGSDLDAGVTAVLDAAVLRDAASDADAAAAPADATAPSDAGPIDGSAIAPEASSDAALSTTPDAGASGKQLALGRAHGCSLDPAISGVLCWGDGQRGQTKVPPLQAPRFVAAGGDVTCAIEGSGKVRCWGDPAHGQVAVPAQLGQATQLAVGEGHACALTASGSVQCWGDNRAAQPPVPPLTGVRSLAAGAEHNCALTSQGVRCWGSDAQGQLRVPPLSEVSQLAVGAHHNCVIQRSGVVCWGGAIPALANDVPAVNEPSAIAVGGSHACVIDRAGVHCWGDPTARSLTPRELTSPRQIALGGGGADAFACARHLQGVACWGADAAGQTRYDGSPLHVLYRAEAEIAAPASKVWAVLMDLPNYAAWNPYTIAMQSSLKVGDPMVMTVRMNALVTLTQTEHIRVLEPGHKACWGIETTTPELNSGERCQWLEPLPSGGTRYVTEDLIEGSLNPVVQALFDADLKVGFEGVARGLKGRVEALP